MNCNFWLFLEILDICCFGAEIYVYHVDGCVKWFGLLSVKECVSILYEMGEIKQCLEVRILSDTVFIFLQSLTSKRDRH